MLRIIDNFLDDPYIFRNIGLKLYNENKKEFNWPGFRVGIPDSLIKKYIPKVESIVESKLSATNGPYFQWVDETWVSGLWHRDVSHYTILIFLNQDAPSNTGIEISDNTITSPTGTKCEEHINDFTSIKDSFYNSPRNYYQRYWFKKKLDNYNSSLYFKDPCIVPNKFNRAVIFERSQVHRAQNFFGKGKNARFTMISFYNKTT